MRVQTLTCPLPASGDGTPGLRGAQRPAVVTVDLAPRPASLWGQLPRPPPPRARVKLVEHEALRAGGVKCTLAVTLTVQHLHRPSGTGAGDAQLATIFFKSDLEPGAPPVWTEATGGQRAWDLELGGEASALQMGWTGFHRTQQAGLVLRLLLLLVMQWEPGSGRAGETPLAQLGGDAHPPCPGAGRRTGSGTRTSTPGLPGDAATGPGGLSVPHPVPRVTAAPGGSGSRRAGGLRLSPVSGQPAKQADRVSVVQAQEVPRPGASRAFRMCKGHREAGPREIS